MTFSLQKENFLLNRLLIEVRQEDDYFSFSSNTTSNGFRQNKIIFKTILLQMLRSVVKKQWENLAVATSRNVSASQSSLADVISRDHTRARVT